MLADLKDKEKDFKRSLEFIPSHFEEPNWPRTNAYPSYAGWKGLNRQAPNFLFIDLDLSRFKSIKALNRVLKKTLKFIKEKLKDDNISPSVLWTGKGYHLYLLVMAFILELESIFAEFEGPSRRFIQWAEQFLTNNKADPCHR